MKKIGYAFLIIFSLFILVSDQACAQRKNSLADFQLVGQVKSCHSVSNKIKFKKDEWIKGERLITEPNKEQALVFDSSGYYTEKNIYNPDGSLQYIIRRKYDQWHNLTAEERCNEKGEALSRKMFKITVNEQGFPFSIQLLNNDSTINGTEQYELNSKNYKTKIKHFSANGQLSFSLYYTYDDHNNLLEYYETENDSIKKFGATYILGPTGKPFPEKLYNSKHELYFMYGYTFNEHGDYIELRYMKPNGKIIRSWSIEYTYDRAGNWTQAIIRPLKSPFLSSKKNGFLTERSITYY